MRRRELLAGLTGLGSAGVLGLTGVPGESGPAAARSLEAVLLGTTAGPPSTVEDLVVRLDQAKANYANCRYQRLASMLPDLVGRAEATRDESSGERADRATAILAQSFRLTSELCIKLDEDGAAWVAADRAFQTAKASGITPVVAEAAQWVAISLRRHGHHDAAATLLTQTAASLAARSEAPNQVLLSCYGSLLCTAAYTSAQGGDRERAIDLIDEAASASKRLGDRPTGGALFSSTNVAVYRIGIHHSLGEPGRALEHARAVDPMKLPTAERRARYCVDTARAWEQYGRPDRAFNALRAAEHAAPEEVRRPSVRNLISALLDAPVATPSGLRALAARSGSIGRSV